MGGIAARWTSIACQRLQFTDDIHTSFYMIYVNNILDKANFRHKHGFESQRDERKFYFAATFSLFGELNSLLGSI